MVASTTHATTYVSTLVVQQSTVIPTRTQTFSSTSTVYSGPGLSWRVFRGAYESAADNHNFNNFQGYIKAAQTETAVASGNAHSISDFHAPDGGYLLNGSYNLMGPNGQTYYVYGTDLSMVFQGYFWPASGPGTYTISSTADAVDDAFLVWVGNAALGTAWTADNNNYTALRADTGGSVTFTVDANTAIPFTALFVQFEGAARFSICVTPPNQAQNCDMSNYLVADCGTSIPPNFSF